MFALYGGEQNVIRAQVMRSRRWGRDDEAEGKLGKWNKGARTLPCPALADLEVEGNSQFLPRLQRRANHSEIQGVSDMRKVD